MSRSRWIVALPLAAAVLAACAVEDDAGEGEGDVSADAITNNREIRVEEDPSLLVEHPETLRALEGHGFDFGTQLTGARFRDLAAFADSGEGASLIDAIDADLVDAKRTDPSVGVGMRFAHRAFDVRWLTSNETSFELAAVANRLDRRHLTAGACGEIHLVYRLAYANAQAKSRLPMTVMVVHQQRSEGGSCAPVARRWLDMRSGTTTTEARAQALAAGPLARLGRADKVEMNYQLVRWPSAVRPDMGGHAEYSLRVFARSGDRLVPAPLENTPREDLSREEQQALGTWIASNVAEIDRGTALVPARFLARKAISVSPKGLARGQNRPFALYFGKDGERLPATSLAGTMLATTKTALVRRLDTMTCNGCHQSNGVAGFHALGTDRQEISDANALIDGVSAHTRALLAYRAADLAASARGQPAVAPVPFAEKGTDGRHGTTCGLGDPAFASWTCKRGLVCSDINGDDLGICVSEGKRKAGEACEEADVTFTGDPHADRVTMGPVLECELPNGAASRCVRSDGGFPTGVCSGACSALGRVEGEAICGLSVPTGFNECIGVGRPFEQCVAGGSKQYRKACSAKTPCGPDYVCAAVPGAPPGIGACMPPYFLFQARVDGHIVGR